MTPYKAPESYRDYLRRKIAVWEWIVEWNTLDRHVGLSLDDGYGAADLLARLRAKLKEVEEKST